MATFRHRARPDEAAGGVRHRVASVWRPDDAVGERTGGEFVRSRLIGDRVNSVRLGVRAVPAQPRSEGVRDADILWPGCVSLLIGIELLGLQA